MNDYVLWFRSRGEAVVRELALHLRDGTISLEDALFSRKLPRAVLYEFACMCAKEILFRGALSHASSIQVRQIQEKHPWLGRGTTASLSERDWLKQVYLSAKSTFWGEEDEEEHLYENDDDEAEELATELSELELKVAARQAIQSRQGMGRRSEEWYAARNAARVRQLHILATLIDAYLQTRQRLCEVLLLRAKLVQKGLAEGKKTLEDRLFVDGTEKSADLLDEKALHSTVLVLQSEKDTRPNHAAEDDG